MLLKDSEFCNCWFIPTQKESSKERRKGFEKGQTQHYPLCNNSRPLGTQDKHWIVKYWTDDDINNTESYTNYSASRYQEIQSRSLRLTHIQIGRKMLCWMDIGRHQIAGPECRSFCVLQWKFYWSVSQGVQTTSFIKYVFEWFLQQLRYPRKSWEW